MTRKRTRWATAALLGPVAVCAHGCVPPPREHQVSPCAPVASAEAACFADEGQAVDAFVAREPAPPREALSLVPLWSRNNLCEGTDTLLGAGLDMLTQPQDFALARMRIAGDLRDVVVAMVDDRQETRGFAVLELRTGTTLACIPIQTKAEAKFVLRSASTLDVVGTMRDELLTPFDLGNLSVQRVDTEALEATTRDFWLGERPMRLFDVQPNGSGLVVAWPTGAVFGIDAGDESAVAWCRDVREMGARRGFVHSLGSRAGSTSVAFERSPNEVLGVNLDRCGHEQGERFSVAPALSAPLMFPDDNSLLALVNDGSESGRALVVSTSEVNRRESGCLTAVQMAEHRWACQSVVEGVRRLVAFDDDGGRRHERVLPSRLDGTLADWRAGMAAADPGTLLLLADTGEPLHARLFAFADRDGLPIAASVDVAPATLTGADHEPPAIADDGTVVVSVSGHLSAFRSNLNGLAPAAYPRGPRHGGNMNLGARRAMNH